MTLKETLISFSEKIISKFCPKSSCITTLTSTSNTDPLAASQGLVLDGKITSLAAAMDEKQDTITGAASSVTSNNLTVNRALCTDSSGKIAVSSVTSTELGYLDGVTSNVQTQLTNLNSQITALTSPIYRTYTQETHTITPEGSNGTSVNVTPAVPTAAGYTASCYAIATNTTADISINAYNRNGVARVHNRTSTSRDVMLTWYWFMIKD